MVLEEDTAQTGRRRLLHRLEVIELPRHGRRAGMDVQVDGALHQPVDGRRVDARDDTPGFRPVLVVLCHVGRSAWSN